MNKNSTSVTERPTSLIQRLGAIGILFFFLKGMAWLSVPALTLLLR